MRSADEQLIGGVGKMGLVSEPPKKVPAVPPKKSAPDLAPKAKREERRVFLDPELWDALSGVALFHQEVFDALEAKEKVSRNDIISAFLTWAVGAYWDDKGGFPTSKEDRAAKVLRHAEKLRKQSEKNTSNDE